MYMFKCSRSREGSLAERACETILAACMGRQGTGRRKGEGEKREARKQRAATQGHSSIIKSSRTASSCIPQTKFTLEWANSSKNCTDEIVHKNMGYRMPNQGMASSGPSANGQARGHPKDAPESQKDPQGALPGGPKTPRSPQGHPQGTQGDPERTPQAPQAPPKDSPEPSWEPHVDKMSTCASHPSPVHKRHPHRHAQKHAHGAPRTPPSHGAGHTLRRCAQGDTPASQDQTEAPPGGEAASPKPGRATDAAAGRNRGQSGNPRPNVH